MRGLAAAAWLSSIEETILFCETKWDCTVGEPFDLSYNFVAPVLMTENKAAVVKICRPLEDFDNELSTLEHYKHSHACKVLDAIPDRGVLLLERVMPGINLKSVSEPEAIQVITGLILNMQSIAPPKSDLFTTTHDLSLGIKTLRNHFNGGSGPFKESTLERVEQIFPEIISTQAQPYLLHGDLHHENILLGNPGWTFIDPEGVLGSVEYELMPFIVNNLPVRDIAATIEHRIDALAQILELDARQLMKWGLCFSLLSAWWNIEDSIGLGQGDLDLIEVFNNGISSK